MEKYIVLYATLLVNNKPPGKFHVIASKFFEHFLMIADAMNHLGGSGLWHEGDGFYYDQLVLPDGRVEPVRQRQPGVEAAGRDGERAGHRQPTVAHRTDAQRQLRPVALPHRQPRRAGLLRRDQHHRGKDIEETGRDTHDSNSFLTTDQRYFASACLLAAISLS